MMHPLVYLFGLSIVSLSTCIPVKVHESFHDKSMIFLKSDHIDTQTRSSFSYTPHPAKGFTATSLSERVRDHTQHTFIVHTNGNISSSIFKDFGRVEYVPHNSYLVHMTHSDALEVESIPEVMWVGNLSPEHKLSLGTIDNNENPLELWVHFARTEDHISKGVIAAWGESKASGPYRAVIKIDSEDRLREVAWEIAQHPEVRHVQRGLNKNRNNFYAKDIAIEGSAGVLPVDATLQNSGITGAGQIIHIGDSGLDMEHCFFSDNEQSPFKKWQSGTPPLGEVICTNDFNARKVVQYVTFGDDRDSNPAQSGHGTHVSGTLAGYPDESNAMDAEIERFSGVAPDAKIAFFDLADDEINFLNVPSDLEEGYFNWGYRAMARVSCNSWGTSSSMYTLEAMDVDSFMFDNKDFVVVVAAGNTGKCSDSFFSVGTPATAKNAISVGATVNSEESWEGFQESEMFYSEFDGNGYSGEEDMAYFSSIGPTEDWRLKPDIVAPGYYIVSTAAGGTCGKGNSLTAIAGTSQAAPVVAASVALARQYFVEGWYPSGSPIDDNAFTPSNALLKNIIINSGRQMTGVKLSPESTCSTTGAVDVEQRPYFDSGFGRLSLNDALYIHGDNSFLHIPSMVMTDQDAFFDDSLEAGESRTYNYCVFPSDIETRVTLVWTDPPSSTSASFNLVNDLDLKVTFERSGRQVLGNSQSKMFEVLDVTEDRLNNVEAVYFDGVTISEGKLDLTVLVDVFRLGMGDKQSFSLVVTGAVADGLCDTSESQGIPNAVITVNSVINDDFPETECKNASFFSASRTVAVVVGAVACALGVSILTVWFIIYRRKHMDPNVGVPPRVVVATEAKYTEFN